MKTKNIIIVFGLLSISILSSFSFKSIAVKKIFHSNFIVSDTIKKDTVLIDSVKVEDNFTYKLYQKKVHASYYADRFNGKKTASGALFNNSNYTAAHKKLPFGTKLRITNNANQKSVIVTVTDRGPFVKGREIDLTKKAFREIAINHGYGSMSVDIEIIEINH